MKIVIDNKIIDNGRTFIIAEAGSNHGGSLHQAKELVDVAVAAGADAIKFQSYEGDSLVGKNHPAHPILDKYSLPKEWHFELGEYCKERGILFGSTPFDEERLSWLEEVGVKFHKVASGDLTYLQFIQKMAATGKPILLSTGMSNLGEVEAAVNAIRDTGNEQIVLLHCVGRYPTNESEVNLLAMQTLAQTFGLPAGFSDHTRSSVIPALAVAMGASVVEKHFTLERELDTPDHSFALRPDELKEMVANIRLAEVVKGEQFKRPTPSELETSRINARRSLHAKMDLDTGEILSEANTAVIRPADGLDPRYHEVIIGRRVQVPIKASEPINLEDVEWRKEKWPNV